MTDTRVSFGPRFEESESRASTTDYIYVDSAVQISHDDLLHFRI